MLLNHDKGHVYPYYFELKLYCGIVGNNLKMSLMHHTINNIKPINKKPDTVGAKIFYEISNERYYDS
jgi:hypothetical protein